MELAADFYMRMLFSHLIGDYLLQNNWMALNKKKKWIPCLVHCAIYSITVVLFLLPEILSFSFAVATLVVIGVFLSHLILDKTPIIEKWLHFIGGRSYKRAIEFAKDKRNADIEKQFYISYTALVQTIADNTIHLLIIYGIFVLVIAII